MVVTTEGPARVAVVSPSAMVAAGIAAMLGRHPTQVEIVPAMHAEPDVVLYDVLGLEGGDGTELDRLVGRPATTVLAVRRDLRPELLHQALAQGADGCLAMSVDEATLLATLDAARAWRRPATARDTILCACPAEQRSWRLGLGAGLNAREAEILAAIVRGLTNTEIAEREFLSINTVKSYIRSAYRKIGVETRSQAVRWALTYGFDPREG
ncbi:response regulator transcription factor [Nocardioides conyzicola]|uniref:HTH luxR-type domain-containing protein n=1 Tax=Nocardioides conyzicola TaxID=1651781 RepID=A0ABP8WTT1_9ACTN